VLQRGIKATIKTTFAQSKTQAKKIVNHAITRAQLIFAAARG